MLDYTLSSDKLTALRDAHRITRDKREADRIKAVVLLATGWSAEQVAEVLQVDPNTVRNHFKRFQQGGVAALGHMVFRRSNGLLTEDELILLALSNSESRCPVGEGVVWRHLYGERHDGPAPSSRLRSQETEVNPRKS